MRRRMEKVVWGLAGSAITLGVALTFGVATGQQGGPPGGFGRGMVQGTVAQKDLDNNAVLVKTQQAQRWVQLPKEVLILKLEDAKLEDLKAKDLITVNGAPTAVTAASVQILPPPKEQAAGAAPAPGGLPGFPGPAAGPGQGRPAAFAMVTGTVESTDPLTVVAADNAKITIAGNDKTTVKRQLQIEVKDLADGEQFTAFGQPQQVGDQEVIQARFAAVGDVRAMMGGMGGGMGGGMFGMGGGPGGGRAGGRRGGRGGGGGGGGAQQ